MKFQQLQPFLHHFTSSFPEHLSPIYLVISSNEQERKKILTDLASYFEKDWDCRRTASVATALEHLGGFSLLSKNIVAICDQSEQIYQHEFEFLLQFVKQPSPQTLLLLGLASDKQAIELYKQGKKEIVILDLSHEKPWDKKERLRQEIVERISREQKKISSQALETIFERLPLDRPILLQEVEKILCFVFDRPLIEKEDVEKICSTSLEMSHFQMAEHIVWDKLEEIPKMEDPSQLLFLVSQLRNHFEMGLSMVSQLSQKLPKETIASSFPQLFPKTLEKYLRLAPIRSEQFFLEGLNHLYALELGVKTSLGPAEIIFARFYAAIQGGKR